MRVVKLYEMLDRDKCILCKDELAALKVFSELSVKLDVIDPQYLPISLLSSRQICVAKNAIRRIGKGELVEALSETYDFVHNYQANTHTLTNAEHSMLSLIVTAALG